MTEVQQGHRRLIFGMVVAAAGLVALHHGDGLGAERRAQPVELGDEMGHVPAGIGENEALQPAEIGQRIFDAEPSAPAMAQEMDTAEAERLAHRLDLLDITPDGPERGVGRPVRFAAAELVVGHDPVTLLDHAQQRLAQIVRRQARAAIQQEQNLGIGIAIAVGNDLMAVDLDPGRGVRLGHGSRIPLVEGEGECRGRRGNVKRSGKARIPRSQDTTRQGASASWMTFWETLPWSRPGSPPAPRRPSTIRSAPRNRATETMMLAGSPISAMTSTSVMPCSRAAASTDR